jgi:hypothetical protein
MIQMKRKTTKRDYEFALVLAGVTVLARKVEDALYEAGCDDATIAMRSGRLFLTFSRTASSLKDAILSAIRDVRKARIGAQLLRVDYRSLVTQSDIARNLGRSRQLIHQYMTGQRGPGGFPPPVCEVAEETALWRWCEVAQWLFQNDMIKEEVLRDAEEVDAINSVLEIERQKRTQRKLTEEVSRTVA